MENLNNIKKMEEFFKTEKSDKKHKINLAENVDLDLDIIEKGVTYEELQSLKVPVCFYNTQITIHGKHKHEFRIGGYKNIFINKNKSLGVRYSAVDYDKKRRIKQYVDSFNCQFTSTIYKLFKVKEINEKNIEDVRSEFLEIVERINKVEFIGNYQIYIGKTPWGSVYMVLEIILNAIKEENVKPFIETLEQKDLETIIEEKKQEEMKRRKELEEWRRKDLEERKVKFEKFKAKYAKFFERECAEVEAGKTYYSFIAEYCLVRIIKVKSINKKGYLCVMSTGDTFEEAISIQKYATGKYFGKVGKCRLLIGDEK